MVANTSRLIVCFASVLVLALIGAGSANHLVRRDLQRIRSGEGDPKNASSTMYFQQLFGKADEGSSGGQAAQGNTPSPSKNFLHHHRPATTTSTTTSKPTLMASDPKHPTSIQAVNATVHGGNLTSSETVNYYGYEPSGHSSTGWMHGYVPVMNVHTIDDGYPATGGNGGGINKRHVHYPPVPMDVINADDDSQNDDGDYNDEDDPDDSDDYDGDSGEGDRASDSPGASDGGGGGDGDGEVYKEVQNGPGKVKSIDNDDFDGDFTFRRRRKREVKAEDGKDKDSSRMDDEDTIAAATSASFVLARECHFSDEGGTNNSRNKQPKAGASASSPSLHQKQKQKQQSKPTKPPKRPKQPLMSRNSGAGAAKSNSATIGASINSPIVTGGAGLLASEQADGPIPHQPAPTSGIDNGNELANGIASLKPKMPTDESRFVPINADPWRSSRYTGGNFGDRSPSAHRSPYYTNLNEYPLDKLNTPSSAYTLDDTSLSSAPPSSSSTMTLSGGGDNTQHFHKYPYPHYHIYYNRPAVSVLDEQSASYGSRDPLPAALPPVIPSKTTATADSDSISDGDDTTEDDGIYNSPNAYFEFTNPNGSGDGGSDSDGGQDDDGEGGDDGGDGGGGDGGDNADGDDDDADDENVGLAASPAESVTTPTQRSAAAASSNTAVVSAQQPSSSQSSSTTTTTAPTTTSNHRARRVRRATRGYSRGFYAADRGALLPLPPTLSPSASKRKSRKSVSAPSDDIYGWAVSGPNFYKSGKFENGDGKKKPKKYSYNYYQREEPDKTEDRDDIYDGDDNDDGGEDGYSQSRPQGRASSRSMKFNINPMPASRRSSKLMADPGDYLINYGSGTFKEYDHEYDSDKDKRLKNKDKDNYDRRGGTGYRGGQDDHQAENDDGENDEDDGSYEGDNGSNGGGGDGHYHDDQGGHGGGDEGSFADEFEF